MEKACWFWCLQPPEECVYVKNGNDLFDAIFPIVSHMCSCLYYFLCQSCFLPICLTICQSQSSLILVDICHTKPFSYFNACTTFYSTTTTTTITETAVSKGSHNDRKVNIFTAKSRNIVHLAKPVYYMPNECGNNNNNKIHH